MRPIWRRPSGPGKTIGRQVVARTRCRAPNVFSCRYTPAAVPLAWSGSMLRMTLLVARRGFCRSSSLIPSSSSVGTSGAVSIRFVAVTASARIFPSLIRLIKLQMAPQAMGVWPPSSDCVMGPPPENGTTVKFSPKRSRSISIDSEGVVPAPGEATVCFRGSRLMRRIFDAPGRRPGMTDFGGLRGKFGGASHLTLPVAAQWVSSVAALGGGGIIAVKVADVEFAVGVFHQPVGARDDHRAYRVAALDMAVVVDFDAVERAFETECLDDAIEQLPLRGTLGKTAPERLACRQHDTVDEALFVATLRHRELHAHAA